MLRAVSSPTVARARYPSRMSRAFRPFAMSFLAASFAVRLRPRAASRFTTSGSQRRRSPLAFGVLACALALAACSNDAKKSAAFAKEHVQALAQVAREDVREVRSGLPLGAEALEKFLPPPEQGEITPSAAREALEKARNKVQDLRIAKSTFFALVAPSGVVIRDDQEVDRLAGKNLLAAFPGLKPALTGGYVETRGSMPEASGVRGKPDAQWVAAVPVKDGTTTRALYATGWSWSAYAYRLENSVRSSARSATKDPGKEPLIYAFVIVDGNVYGAPISPEVNARAVHDQDVLSKLHGAEPMTAELEITGRPFGLAAELAPELGDKVALAVLRSET